MPAAITVIGRRPYELSDPAFLTGVCLAAVNLKGAYLKDISFGNSNLHNAYFYDTRYSRAAGDPPSGVLFQNADLTGADFQGVDLSNVPFYDTTLDKAELDNAVLRGTNFAKSRMIGARILTDLTDTCFQGTDLSEAVFYAEDTDGSYSADHLDTARFISDPQQTAQTAVRSVRDRSWTAVNDLLIRHYREVIAERLQADSTLQADSNGTMATGVHSADWDRRTTTQRVPLPLQVIAFGHIWLRHGAMMST
ncbi:pentapeptide repeat-containing protein [Nocardia sp. NPDC059246]|uniref:pentapeptide repeat-containing protein n=1 Tax=unclassified Nocardia TaxID=2637762 RepID=UPI00367E4C1F